MNKTSKQKKYCNENMSFENVTASQSLGFLFKHGKSVDLLWLYGFD